MDGTNGGTTFVDNSASAHPISTGGAVNTSTTQTKFGSASAEFDDSTSYLTVPDSVDWDFYNGDFTIDFWVYLNSLSSGSQFFIGQYESASINYQFYFDQTFGFVHAIEDGGPQHAVMIQNNTTGWSANTWHHVALTRSGNTWRIFLDGTQVVTTNDSGPIGDMTGPLWIGAFGNNTVFLDGYMDELRIIKGTAVWTSNFTPPISAYCDVDCVRHEAQTVLLMHMDGADTSTTFTDNSLISHTPSVVGNTAITTSTSKFGGSSGNFQGSADYITIPDSDTFDLSDAWTIEAWGRPTSFTGNFRKIASRYTDNSNRWQLGVNSSNQAFAQLVISGASYDISGSGLSTNTWYHFAMSYDGTDLRLFLDGVLQGSVAAPSLPDINDELWVGSGKWNGTHDASSDWIGQIDELRIINGEALYISSFTPPAVPFCDPVLETQDPNTVLLLHMDGTDGSTTFTDNSASAHTVTAVGNAQVDTSRFYFGGSSALFDGSGDYLSVPDSDDWFFDTGDFTIELWVKASSAGGWIKLMGQRNSAGLANSDLSWVFGKQSGTGKGHFEYFSGAGTTSIFSSADVFDDTWHHVAIVRNDTDLTMYVDGSATDGVSTTLSGGFSFSNSSTTLSIGRAGDYNGEYYTGHIDELQIIKGTALYTSDFCPPNTPYANS
jgi:hypothetical protein